MSASPTLAAAAEAVRAGLGGAVPKVAIVTGSGLGAVAGAVEASARIPYAEIPGFPAPTVGGHAGEIVAGTLAGRAVMVLCGRVHAYEGLGLGRVTFPVRVLAELGVEMLVLTNAAGSLRDDAPPGSLVLITDHVNWSGLNPLTGGEADGVVGEGRARFVDMTRAWDRDLADAMRRAAAAEGIALPEGVYFWVPGPSFETPAEIRAFKALGADLVGMSTVPEAIVARQCGIRLAGLSAVTNMAAGMAEGDALDHARTLTEGDRMAKTAARLLARFLAELEVAPC